MRDEDFENVSGDEPLRHLQEGIYCAQLKRRQLRRYVYRGKMVEKLVLEWQVFLSRDHDQSVTLPGYYNITRGGGGRLHFGPCSAYRRDWIAANGGKHPLHLRRLPLTTFSEKLLFVLVVTVQSSDRGPMHPANYYSKVQCVMRPVEEGEDLEGLPIQPSDFKWKPS